MSVEEPLKSTTVRWYYRPEREIWEGKGLNLLHIVPGQIGSGIYVSFIWPARMALLELDSADLHWGAVSSISKGLIPSGCPFRLTAQHLGGRIIGDLYYSDAERPVHGVLTKKGPV